MQVISEDEVDTADVAVRWRRGRNRECYAGEQMPDSENRRESIGTLQVKAGEQREQNVLGRWTGGAQTVGAKPAREPV